MTVLKMNTERHSSLSNLPTAPIKPFSDGHTFNDYPIGGVAIDRGSRGSIYIHGTDAIPLYALKCRKARNNMVSGLKARGSRIKVEVSIDKPNSRNQRYKRKQLDRWPIKISDQDTDQVNGILG